MAAIVKFVPFLLVASLGGMIAFNRESQGNNEEKVMNEMGKGYQNIEKDWGDQSKLDTNRKISFWKKEAGGFERTQKVRKETHKDIFIFDLCNKWIKFANENQENGGGYGYTWQDICEIVKNREVEVGWFQFVAQVMNSNNGLVVVNECCGDKNICNGDRQWDKGKWIKKCFELEISKKNLNLEDNKKKVCNSFLERNSNEEVENNCLDSEINKRISEKIKISRNQFGDSGSNSNYWCSGKEKKEGKIDEGCKNTLKQKIKEFVERNKNPRDDERKMNLKNSCIEEHDGKKLEINCKDGWILKIAKS